MQNGRAILLLLFAFFVCIKSEEWSIPNIKDDIETRRTVCTLRFDRGTSCGPAVIRWYFDRTKQICRSFDYNGCEGNSNNFPTQDFCNSYCNRACPYDAKPLRKENGGIKICTAEESCPSDYNCTEVTVENLNIHYCCPTKYSICNQVPTEGETCAEDSTRYHFNPSQKSCGRFTFKGCNGNSNNFNTSGDCLDFCQSTACLPGEHALRTKAGIQTCDPANGNNSCSAGFACRRDNLYDRNICCGSKPRVCPEDSKPYVESGIGKEARFCEVGTPDACPSPYICAPNFDEGINYCCAPSSDDGFCLKGQKVYRSDVTSLPKVCRLQVPNDCPAEFKCTSAYEFAIEGYCCSDSPNYNDTVSLEDAAFSMVFMDDPVSDNDTIGLRNVSRASIDLLGNATDTASSILKNVSETVMSSARNVSQTITGGAENVLSAPAMVATQTQNVANVSSQLANSGKEAFVNLITECQSDNVCPIGFVCQRNNITKRSTCLLISLAASDFVPSDNFANETMSLVTIAKNLSTNLSKEQTNATGCNTNCSVNMVAINTSMTSFVPAKTNVSCVSNSDCSMNSTCAQTAGSGSICVQEQLLINVTKCSDIKASQLGNATSNLFCSLEQPCPLPYQCSTVNNISVCCGPF